MSAPKQKLTPVRRLELAMDRCAVARGGKVTTMGAGWYLPDHPKHVRGLGFNTHADRATRNSGGSWFNVANNTTSGRGQNPDGRKVPGLEHGRFPPGGLAQGAIKNGGDWFGAGASSRLQRRASSKSPARKAASARIAKIPAPLAQHIARVYRERAS